MKVNTSWQFECNYFFEYKKEIFCWYYYQDQITILHYRTGWALPFRIDDSEFRYSPAEIMQKTFDFLKKYTTKQFYKVVRNKKLKIYNEIKLLKKRGIEIKNILDFIK